MICFRCFDGPGHRRSSCHSMREQRLVNF